MKLGKLKEVDIRNLWKHEQYDFSNWLSKQENIDLINEEIGLTLVDVDKEVYVGSYRCDLVGQDETTGERVIIENQLEATNHDHLGKIITYAAGLDATTIIWIVKEAREEHRAAIEWLNNNIAKEISFFLLEIHAYQINDSIPAPMFKVIEKPNDFVKNSKNTFKDKQMNQSASERLNFWTEFNNVIVQKGKPFNTRKPSTDHWYNVALGSSDAHISIDLINRDSNIVVQVYIPNNKELFDKLFERKDEIEKEIPFELVWDRLDNAKAARIKSYIHGLNFEDHSNYSELMDEIVDRSIQLKSVFSKYIK